MTQRAEERLLADQRRYQQLLVAAAEGMLTVLDLRKLLRRIVGAVVKYVGLTYAAIYLQEEPEGPYRFQVCRGRRLEFPETFDSEDVLVHYLQAAKAPVVVEELRRHVREAHAEYLTHLCDRLTQLKASVIVPAIFETPLKKRLIGFMFLGEKSSQAMFTADDLSTFWNLAHVAAIAIRTARLHRRVVDIETLEATGELYSVVNHELGNVQHIISMQIGYLKEKAKNGELSYEEMTAVLNRAEETAVRGHTIIEDGKSYRKQSGQLGIQPFSMGDLLRDTAQALQKRFSTCPGITLKLDIPTGLPLVEGRATLASLPLSLLSISYWALAGVPEPSGTISISVRENKPEGKVEIRTSDTGTSLRNLMDNPKEIGGGKMFPHRGKHGGLYFFLVRKIVAEHNGTFTVMDGSEAGEGAVLIVRIPLKYTPPPEEEADEETIGSAA
jgi:signal transduction histidine kinase